MTSNVATTTTIISVNNFVNDIDLNTLSCSEKLGLSVARKARVISCITYKSRVFVLTKGGFPKNV